MAKYKEADCRQCRREGAKLFLKGAKCLSDKCTFEKKGYPPGERGKRMQRRESDYALRLREKQKLKRMYGISEKQLENYFKKAKTGEDVLKLMETRLDNVIYRAGLAPSRKAARQLVRHRHFLVNGRVTDIPSYKVSPGESIQVRQKSKDIGVLSEALERVEELPWLKVDRESMQISVVQLPERENIPTPVNERLVVEFYSK